MIRAVTLVTTLCLAGSVSAHGLAPAGLRALQNSDGALTGLLATYGLVTFDDDGTPLWVCEEASGEEGVPRAAVRTDDGALVVVGPREGLFVSHDEGCSYASVAALDDVIVTDVARDVSGRVLVATRDPRTDGMLAVVDVDAHTVTTLATFSNAIVDGFASDGVRVAVALTGVGDGANSLVVVDESGVKPVVVPRTPALPFVDGVSRLVIAMPFNGSEWSLTVLDEDGELRSSPNTLLRRRPIAFVEIADVRVVVTDVDVYIDSPQGTFSSDSVTAPSSVVESAGEALLCATGRDEELVSLSPDGEASSRFDTASVRPRACAEGTRGATVCPAIWDFLQTTQAIGRESPRENDDDTSGCAACRVAADAPLSTAATALVVVFFSARRRRKHRP